MMLMRSLNNSKSGGQKRYTMSLALTRISLRKSMMKTKSTRLLTESRISSGTETAWASIIFPLCSLMASGRKNSLQLSRSGSMLSPQVGIVAAKIDACGFEELAL